MRLEQTRYGRRDCAPRWRRRGVSLIYTTVVLAALLPLCGLAVDWGRVVLVREELQGAADAAARTGALGVGDGTYRTRAKATAAANKADGAAVVLADADIVQGNYDAALSPAFSTGRTPINAVQVTARSSPDLVFLPTAPLTRTAIAMTQPGLPWFGLVGLEWVNLGSSSVQIDSYNSAGGPYAVTHGSNATMAGNGTWDLHKNADLLGEIYYAGASVPTGADAAPRTRLDAPLEYTPSTVPASAIEMGNYSSNANLVLTAGDYVFDSFTLSGNRILSTTGKVRMFVRGDIDLQGEVLPLGGKAANLEIHTVGDSGVNINLKGNSSLIANIYAPNSAVNIGGTGDIYGAVIAKGLDLSGGGAIHLDEALGETSESVSKIRLVQ